MKKNHALITILFSSIFVFNASASLSKSTKEQTVDKIIRKAQKEINKHLSQKDEKNKEIIEAQKEQIFLLEKACKKAENENKALHEAFEFLKKTYEEKNDTLEKLVEHLRERNKAKDSQIAILKKMIEDMEKKDR